VRSLGRDVLREFGQEIQRREDLIIPPGARLQAVSTRVGKGAAASLLCLVDHLPRVAHLHQSGQTKRAPCHVLHQTLDPCPVARRQEHRLIEAKAADHRCATVPVPSAHVLDDFWLDLLLGQVQGKDRFLPGDLKPLQIQFGQFQKIGRRGKRSAGHKHMQMRMPMQQLAVSLDGRDHARHDVVATQQTSDFRLDELPFPILPWSIVVDVETNSTEFLFRFWGTMRTNLIGKDMTGETSSSIQNSFMREGNIKEYLEICNQKKPMLFDTPVVKESGLRATFQSIRLPLSDDGKSVSKIFSALNYQLVSEAHFEFYGTEPRNAGSQRRGSL